MFGVFALVWLVVCGFHRYFQCVPTFGLFAPVSKVSRVASSLARRGSGSVSRIPVGTSLMLSRERSGSQESLSSLGSVTSSVSRSRLRLGVTSLAGQVSTKQAKISAQCKRNMQPSA